MTQTMTVLTDINCPDLKLFKKGKVRHVYDFGDKLLIVSSDRVSAFDFILPNGVPHKGRVLTTLSEFWFNMCGDICQNHLISTDINDFPEEAKAYAEQLEGRSMLVHKTDLIEIECVVRGYIAGSGWKEYKNDGTVCGQKLPEGLRLADPLPELIFTPATKADEGHDENISVARMAEIVGQDLTDKLKNISLALYKRARDHADKCGIILADTKFEFGMRNGEIILIDEIFTPDSSRYWPKSDYQPGVSPPSYDKQIIRDYLESTGWDKEPPIPTLPEEIIQKTMDKYLEVEALLKKG